MCATSSNWRGPISKRPTRKRRPATSWPWPASSSTIRTILGPAERDLQSRTADEQGRNCRAESYLGSVFVKRELWREAAVTFESAMACYQRDIKGREIDPGHGGAQRRARRPVQGRANRPIAAPRSRLNGRGEFAAALNAANFHAATGNLDKAKILIEIAAKDPELSGRGQRSAQATSAGWAARGASRP